MSRTRSHRLQGAADVEECPHDPTLQGHGAPQKPVTAEEALEIAIGESQDVEYTIDSDNSPYLEVRANVPNTDDPTLPINTFRMWFLGIVFTLVGTGVNQFFSMRYPSVTITSLVAQLISYPVGCFFAKALPIMTIRVFGREIPINPDHHFNVKEHAVITIMSNLSFNQSWASAIIQAQKVYLGMPTPVGYQILLALSMQMFGLGLAGLSYRYIIEPPHMIWPSTLANAALFQTLHSGANPIADGWRISRYRFFLYVFIGSFCWYWLPGYIFTGLSTFAFICWAAPNNKVVNNLFGMTTGLGYMPTTFDWSQIAYNTSPLTIPFWAQANVFAGWFCIYAVIAPILYYTNTWYTAYLPLTGSDAYDNTGNLYNSTRILNDEGAIDSAKYREYSPIFLPITFALSYGVGFAVLSCLLTHVVLHHTKDILDTFRGQNKKDIHARLLSRYPDVAWWWYAVLTVIVVAVAIMVQYVWNTGLPFWGLFITLALATLYVIPVGTVYAVANLNANVLTVLGEIVSGYLLKGKPLVLLIFKLGLYMKIPRRTLFVAQLIACILGTLTQNGVLLWMLGHVTDVCASDQPNNFTCPQGRVNYNSAVFWGAIGPARLYNIGQRYSGLLNMFWIGALLPIITFFLRKKYPNNRILNAIHWPIFFAGTGNLPPATGINYSTAFVVSLIFNKIIKGHRPNWWAKYNYVLSAALDSGVAVSAILIFFSLVLPGVSLSWWGNNVNRGTVDSKGTPWLELKLNETFGESTWS
ncbi:OPT oligopeptide transporter protein-domain-containing protein [Aspergillus pseudotamarii]|uniref:OPT oligopeptide transporter protein-domain-containing protein n=1 Tax=Aspergillus pseudotamarii TaxID=132259 RepID=A0A5N6SSB1_ASPPS|nr:OPT oligopeptide transporter protein-domain-containing protein [Aspergillus pseudotamarii]KAE8136024.1 OPT oligopeptide transporter protein-domain-containing protein [Aspergillus pseudotamarii]